MLTLDVYNTHMELYPYKQFDLPWLEKQYTAMDKYTNTEYACGYIIHDGKMYLPRGTSISKIQAVTGCVVNMIKESDPIEYMDVRHSSIYEPRNKVQYDSIDFLKGEGHQLGLNLRTGFGKCEPISRKIPCPDCGYKLMGDIRPGDRVFGSDGKPVTVLQVFPQGKKDIYRITFSDGRIAECGLEHLWNVSAIGQLNVFRTKSTSELIDGINARVEYFIPIVSHAVRYPHRNVEKSPFDVGLYGPIDDDYLYNDPIIRKQVLQGLICRKGKLSGRDLVTAKWLAFSLGLELSLYNEEWIVAHRIDRVVKIKDIKLVREEVAQCIMVDAPDQLYLTEDFIVTHNTFCVAYTSTMLNVRTLIVTPNTGLKNQWIKTYKTMFDYRNKHLVDIAGSPIMDAIMDGDIKPADVYFVNHQTMRSYLAQYGPYKFRQFFQKLGAGIKVYDESHMEFANILLIDFFSNTDRTWYLTATFDRSDKTESVCFRHAFASVDTFGKEESTAVTTKHVIYHTVNINSRISPKNRARLMGYPGFTAAKYGRYCIFDDPNDTAYKATLAILNKTKNMEGKTLIFLPLIDDVEEVVKRLKRDFPDKSVAAYHSKIDKEEKESAEKKDIIVTTIKSCGTGRDIKGLRCIICLEPVASKVVTEQTIGRLRPYAEGKDTYYFDILDTCIQPLNYWHKSRFKVAQALAKEVIQLNDVLAT